VLDNPELGNRLAIPIGGPKIGIGTGGVALLPEGGHRLSFWIIVDGRDAARHLKRLAEANLTALLDPVRGMNGCAFRMVG
jgi:hypothetical protein